MCWMSRSILIWKKAVACIFVRSPIFTSGLRFTRIRLDLSRMLHCVPIQPLLRTPIKSRRTSLSSDPSGLTVLTSGFIRDSRESMSRTTSARLFYLCIFALVVMAVSLSYENRERFESLPVSGSVGPVAPGPTSGVAPALANLLATPVLTVPSLKSQVDVLQRGADEQVKTKEKEKEKEPSCPPGPDMTQYIRIKDIPCWNCNVSETIH